MFGNLIESGSQTRDIKRRSTFFLGTLAFYAVLLSAAGVASIYAYDAHLKDEQDWTLVAMMRFAPVVAAAEPERREPTKAADAKDNRTNATRRTEIVINTPIVPSRTVADGKTPEVAPKTFVVIDTVNANPVGTGAPIGTEGTGNSRTLNPGAAHVSVPVDNVEPPPAPKQPPPAQQPRPKVVALTSYVISSKVTAKPVPVYPAIAKAARIHGPVAVQILVDESGKVVSAKATSGHQLLQGEAVRAAYRARFTPTLLTGQPVKVTGVITYNFVLQ